MQGQWSCYFKKRRELPRWEMTIVDQTPPGGPLTLQVSSQLDGNVPVTYRADGQVVAAPAFFGRGSIQSRAYQAPVNARFASPCGVVSHLEVVADKGPKKLDAYLYPQGGGVVRIYRQTEPAGESIPEVSCQPIRTHR